MSDEKTIIEKVSERRKKEKEKEEKKQKLLDKIKGWEEDGWEVSHLEKEVREDLEEGKNLIEEYQDRIKRLEKINDKYESLKRKFPLNKFNINISDLENDLKDPEEVEKLEKRVPKLEKRIKKIKKKKREKRKEVKKRNKLMKKVKKWKDEGFKVDKLVDLLKEDFEEGKKTFEEYENNIDELKLLRKKYHSLGIREQTPETIEIEHKLNDPTSVEELKEKIERLEERERLTQPGLGVSQSTTQLAFQEESPAHAQQEPEVIALDSKKDWQEIFEDQRRNESMFKQIRDLLKNKEELEDELVDHFQTDPELRKNFLHYIDYWNRNLSSEDGAKYFKVLETNTDYKVIKIYPNSPFLACLYGVASLLEEEKIGISKSTHPHLYFEEYLEKLYGEESERLKNEVEDNKEIYYF